MTARFNLACADAVEWLGHLPAESANLCVTDVAYESLEKHRAVGTTTRLKREWFDIFPNDRYPELFSQLYRVLKRGSHLYFFSDQETMFIVKPIAESAGFKFWKPLVWHKTGGIGMGYHWRASYEFILFFEKGKRRLNDLSLPDLLAADRVRNSYPTEKPVKLVGQLVANSSIEGELVIDPFMGSGTTGAAACSIGRHFMGCDNSPKAVTRTRERLSAIGATEAEPTWQPVIA